MTTRPQARRHLASSPFKPEPTPVIATYELNELVSHDLYGLGRVIALEAEAVSVDFRSEIVRIVSPFAKLSAL